VSQVSPAQIAFMIATNAAPDEDTGISNVMRFNRVTEVFGRDSLDLGGAYPYPMALENPDPVKVQAMIDLAILQHQYTSLRIADQHVTPDDGDAILAWLDLMIAKMEWHLNHLKQGVPTPPWPSMQ
jgi:hypothetical protein